MTVDPQSDFSRAETYIRHARPSPLQWFEFAAHFNLSRMQFYTMKLLFDNCPCKLLAQKLECSAGSANVHRRQLYGKLGVADRSELVQKIWDFCMGQPAGKTLPPPVSEHLHIVQMHEL